MALHLKDKRVDKRLSSEKIGPSEIFYSPIRSWLFMIFCILLSGGLFWTVLPWKYLFLLLPYFGISYLLHAYFNNSFALQQDRLIVINPNFPFRRLEILEKAEIEHIRIDRMQEAWWFVFLVGRVNYLSIKTPNKTIRYYCGGLELDAFDENWVDRTLEELQRELEKNKFPVIFAIKD